MTSFLAQAQKDKAEKVGWKLGMQLYSFHKFTYQEAIEKTHSLGLKYAEIYFGQPLGMGQDGVMDYNMDEAIRKRVLNYARSNDIKIMAGGVVSPKNEEEWRQLFEFAKAMKIELITCEPAYEDLKMVDELANKYKIDIAIHNHPEPSLYWNPDLFMEHVKGLSKRVGACVDIGHWKRMGIDPVDGLKKIEGRVKSLHFKDVMGGKAGIDSQHDVIWGQGVVDIEGVMKELKRQKFKGLISIEYEYNVENSLPDIETSIRYFMMKVDKIF